MMPLKTQIHLRIVPCRKKIIPSEEMVLIEQFAKKAKLHNNHGILFFSIVPSRYDDYYTIIIPSSIKVRISYFYTPFT